VDPQFFSFPVIVISAALMKITSMRWHGKDISTFQTWPLKESDLINEMAAK